MQERGKMGQRGEQVHELRWFFSTLHSFHGAMEVREDGGQAIRVRATRARAAGLRARKVISSVPPWGQRRRSGQSQE